jgi:outer membrane protein OmpA-like peptidoglycan-associated protein/tetratricopeptide (TPR) repeat protein
MANLKFYLLILLWVPTILLSQSINKRELNKKEEKLFIEAKSAAQKGELEESNEKYTELLSKQPRFVEGILRLASNYYSLGQFSVAETYFIQAIEIDPRYDSEMYYSLGIVRKEQKKYLASAESFAKYIEKETMKVDKIERTKAIMANMLFIENAIKNPVAFEPKALGPNINSKFSEYSPSLSLDGKSLIFTRNNGQEDFYISSSDSSGFLMAKPIFGMNTAQNEGAHAISADGKFMVFSACHRYDAFGGCDLYYSIYSDNKWTTPINMGHVVNSAAWDSQPSLSADGRILYFASNRLGTIGQSDLWMTYRDERNKWVTPINLGPTINSLGKEETPFLHPDNQTLYFRSNGRPGMGQFDIYVSRKDRKTDEWTEPINLGYPINSEGDEGGLIVSLDGKTGYFSSDMDYNSNTKMNQLDLFSFDLYEGARPIPTTFVKGIVIDEVTKKPLKAQVAIKELSTSKIVFEVETDSDGYFIGGISVGKNYACIVESKDYIYQTVNFDLTGIKVLHKPYELDIRLKPLNKIEIEKPTEEAIVLHNIFFKSGSAELLPESNTEIELLVKLLVGKPNFKIKISGHTDDVGEEKDNLILSQNRTLSVANALIARKIDFSRIVTEGFGEQKPIASNNTEEGRQLNRRTEYTLIK